MRYFYKFIIAILIIGGCYQKNQVKPGNNEAAPKKEKDTVSKNISKGIDIISPAKNDTTLINLSLDILKSFKKKDYQQLAAFMPPGAGTRFSPYGFVDTLHDQILSAKQLTALSQDQKKIQWGIFDGTGEPIKLSLDKYFDKFVYDVDFLNAKKRSVNKMIGAGNSLNNLQSIYPGCDFIEFYFPAFDPKYEGMDWKGLRLVFKKEKTKYYLVAIIHDQWTI
jgi:hypothetical protein